MNNFLASSHSLARLLCVAFLLVLAVYLLFRARETKGGKADRNKIIFFVFAAAIINMFASIILGAK